MMYRTLVQDGTIKIGGIFESYLEQAGEHTIRW